MAGDLYQQLASCIQVAAPGSTLLQRFPRMRPLGKLQQHSLDALAAQQQAQDQGEQQGPQQGQQQQGQQQQQQQGQQQPAVYPAFEVYKPNSKFSRKAPDAVAWRVLMTGRMIPSLAAQRAADSYCTDGARLRMAIVQDGDVSFYGLEPASLTQFIS